MVEQGRAGDKELVFAAIGNFDGVHIGHQHLINRLKSEAAKHGAQTAIVLFDPHPRRYFRPDDPPFLINTLHRRDGLLFEHGIDRIHSLPFDVDMARLSAEEFVVTILGEDLEVSGILVGKDFRFGKGRVGDGALLQTLGAEHGIEVILVDTHALESGPPKSGPPKSGPPKSGPPKSGLDDASAEKVGSSAIRSAIANGQMGEAAKMLGRLFDVTGTVETGQKLGRTIGFPTANILLGDVIAPKQGVYIVEARVESQSDKTVYQAIANYGRRPTVGANEPLLEVHFFDFEGDLYGQEINIAFIEFIRDERKFDNIKALKSQIETDCEQARAFFTGKQG